jgi:hypothetical protein
LAAVRGLSVELQADIVQEAALEGRRGQPMDRQGVHDFSITRWQRTGATAHPLE